ncbi:MAG TPA: chemotaxis protein CheB [Candidatus Competibacter sp.]|nr:chemotaxis protein CheB [Candidatus Competibacter sp.]
MPDDDHSQGPSGPSSPVYYVGIGASAGGLEALESFFSHMAADSGMAFIVIQHLSPDYKSMMVELLSKRTAMPVRRAEEGMRVEADSVYLIPPKKILSIVRGKLLLSESDHNRGLNLPIDVFLRSLAQDQAEKTVAIILSGTGSDGVRGIRAVKEAGGVVLVQDEESARFDGMPRAAVSTGLADFVLPPDAMPERLLSFIQHPCAPKPDRPPALLLSDEDGLARIFALLRERTRVDFTHYKPSTMIRRIERRMTMNQIHDLRDYVRFMEGCAGEVMVLYRELLIGVTSFFRDREVFDELENKHLPQLFERVETGEVRFWVAGCSTGEEAYTLAMLGREVLERLGKPTDIKIFATDLDHDAILRASGGVYPESIVADLPPGYLSKYFHRRQDHHYQVDRSLREMVVFAQHNLIKDPPFTKIELVSCRNLLIYLQPILQRKAMELMNFSLNPQGLLLLGSSETPGDLSDAFETLHQKFKIYASKGKRNPTGNSLEFAVLSESRPKYGRPRFSGGAPSRDPQEERLLDRLLQALADDYVPLAVVVNEQREALYILGDPEGYFQLQPGKMLNDVAKIAVRELATPLATGLQRVFSTGDELKYSGIRVKRRDGLRTVQIRIRLLPGKRGQEALAVVLVEPAAAQPSEPASVGAPVYDLDREAEQRIRDLEQELQFSRENLQATIEELETANEELQATNEELLASNEELQSTNEELQSTNEELQSVNEELHTVNAEHQSKIVELVELNNDLDNLITSTRIATLFLDENMIIRRFTPGIKRIFKMLDGDVGRPVSHLLHTLADVEPYQLARAVMRGDGEQEREVHTEDGAWFLMRVLPYHVSAETVSGVVLTFTDISLLKMAREALSERETRLASLYRAVPVGVGRIAKRVFLEANRQLCQMLGYDSEELIGRSTRVLYLSDDAFESAGKDFYGRIQEQGAGTVETRWRRRDGMVVPVLISGSVLDPENPDDGVTFAVLDLSDRESALAKLRESERVAHAALDALTAHIAILDETGTILTVNRAWRKFALKNGGALDQVAEGVNYLEVCDRAQGDEAGDAAAFAAGIRAVLRGDCQRFVYGYPCHSASEQRCFVGRAIRLPGEGPTRVVVAHELSRAGPAENGGLP